MLKYDLKDDIIYKINKFLKHYIIDNMYLTNSFTNSYFYSIKSVRENAKEIGNLKNYEYHKKILSSSQ